MDKIAEMAFKSFHGFIKRAVVPSSSFFFIFAVLYLWFGSFYDHDYVGWIKAQFVFEWYVYAMIFVGLSYFLSIMQQVLFDNFLKGNFTDDREFTKLRGDVIQKLKKRESLSSKEDGFFVDYTLYQLLGKTANTKSYVDDAKAIGIFAISLMINLLIAGWVADCHHYFLYASAAVFLVWTIGLELTRQRYKSRAVRVYLTYLYGDVEK